MNELILAVWLSTSNPSNPVVVFFPDAQSACEAGYKNLWKVWGIGRCSGGMGGLEWGMSKTGEGLSPVKCKAKNIPARTEWELVP